MTIMAKRNRKALGTITEALRRTLRESDPNYRELERQTGVKRQSLMKFARGEQSLRLDMADKLAAYFGFELKPAARRKAE